MLNENQDLKKDNLELKKYIESQKEKENKDKPE